MQHTARLLDELAAIGTDLLMAEPFYAHLFGSINKEIVGEGHEVETLAVGMGHNSLTLYVNQQFWDEELIERGQRYGVLKHEMLHLIFRHLFVRDPSLHYMTLNIAFDLVVNQYIRRDQLPADSIFLEAFAELNLQKEQTWFYYYQKLMEHREKEGGSETEGNTSDDPLQRIRSNENGLERHQPWRNIRSRSAMEQAVLENHLDSLMRSAHQRTQAAAWGALPAGVRERLDPVLFPPPATVNWHLALRQFAASTRSTRLRNTLRRPSRRYGTTPGLQIARQQRLLVAVDSSGSIGQEEFRLFFNELRSIWRAGALIEVVECDTKIQARYPYQGRMPQQVTGRGGTDFSEPIQLANTLLPDGFIYFTDGYAGAPQVQPRVPTFWLIAPGGLQPGQEGWGRLPGRKVKM
jgi:predicted metal-dependent peptidase